MLHHPTWLNVVALVLGVFEFRLDIFDFGFDILSFGLDVLVLTSSSSTFAGANPSPFDSLHSTMSA